MNGDALVAATTNSLSEQDKAWLSEAVDHIEDRVKILRDAEPFLIDMSAREATLSSYFGHTLTDKKELYEQVRFDDPQNLMALLDDVLADMGDDDLQLATTDDDQSAALTQRCR